MRAALTFTRIAAAEENPDTSAGGLIDMASSAMAIG